MCTHCEAHGSETTATISSVADRVLQALFFTKALYDQALTLGAAQREVLRMMALVGLRAGPEKLVFTVVRRVGGWTTIAFPTLGGSELVLADGGDLIGGFFIRLGDAEYST